MSCLTGYTLIRNICYEDCPSGYDAAEEDPSICVRNAISCADAGFTSDLVNPSTICVKTPVPAVDGLCATNYTQWVSGQCYINCPPIFQENGLSCLKRSIQRYSILPTCSFFFTFENGACRFSYFGICILLLILWGYIWIRKTYS